MRGLVRPFLDHWRLTALLSSAGLLAVAHAFETFGGYAPCHLCLLQRDAYWTAIAVALAGMIAVRVADRSWVRAAGCAALALVFAVGCGIAVYHAGAEWKLWPGPQSCSGVSRGVTAESLRALLNGAKVRPPACDQAPWVFLGLSMAGWNALVSLKLAVLSVAAARKERARR